MLIEYITEEHFGRSVTKKMSVVGNFGIDQSKFEGSSDAKHFRKSIVYCGALKPEERVFLAGCIQKIIRVRF
jgi:hypothetical protein